MKSVRVFLAAILGLVLCTPVFSDEKFFKELAEKAKAGDAQAQRKLLSFAKLGYADAESNLGNMYYLGDGVPQDYAEALKWFRKSAAQGNAKAQLGLGVIYLGGKGVPKDYAESLKWFRKSAEQGDAKGPYMLGVMYAEGAGVPKSKKEAAKWHRMSAERGYAPAQCELALICSLGIGVPVNEKEAKKWILKSAEQEHAEAQASLGILYFEGGGGHLKDDVLGYMWMNLAISNAEIAVGQRYKALLSQQSKRMSKQAIAEGQKLSREWMARKAKEDVMADAKTVKAKAEADANAKWRKEVLTKHLAESDARAAKAKADAPSQARLALMAAKAKADANRRIIKNGAKVVFRSAPVYPSGARRSGIEGKVVVLVGVAPSGRVSNARVESSSGSSSLDAAALTAARLYRFVPATDSAGQAVATKAVIPFIFRLRGEPAEDPCE
ncbi:TonB family protein [bacterium]|nr:TonB family protein [bacterium]